MPRARATIQPPIRPPIRPPHRVPAPVSHGPIDCAFCHLRWLFSVENAGIRLRSTTTRLSVADVWPFFADTAASRGLIRVEIGALVTSGMCSMSFFFSCCCCVRSCDLNKPSSQRERERPCFAYVCPFCLLLAFTYFGVCETPHTLSAICSLRSLKQKATRTLSVLFWTGQPPPGRPTVNCHRFTRDKSRRNFHPPSALVVVAEVTAGVRCLTGRHLFQSLIS